MNLDPKPVPIPDRVRDMLFGIMRELPENVPARRKGRVNGGGTVFRSELSG